MRQVPFKFLIVGRGRAARHFQHYLQLLNIPFTQWDRGNSEEDLSAKASNSEAVLVLISDKAIEEFLKRENLPPRRFHFSGSLVIDCCLSCHPLMAFSQNLYSLELYKKIPFICDEALSERQRSDLDFFFRFFPNPNVRLPRSSKSLYHAWCVLAGNLPIFLWSHFAAFLSNETQLDHQHLEPYLQQNLENFLRLGPGALTGPLIRGDSATIEKNLQALQGSPFFPLYEQFVESFIKGGLPHAHRQ